MKLEKIIICNFCDMALHRYSEDRAVPCKQNLGYHTKRNVLNGLPDGFERLQKPNNDNLRRRKHHTSLGNGWHQLLSLAGSPKLSFRYSRRSAGPIGHNLQLNQTFSANIHPAWSSKKS